jgi:hypothetical protein
MKTNVRIAVRPAKIETTYLQNTSLECYCYINLLRKNEMG